MKLLSLALTILLGEIALAPLGAQVTFGDLDLDSSGALLFSARTESPVFGEYTTLFKAQLQERSITQLTFFPERVTLLEGETRIQIQNRFGVFSDKRRLAGSPTPGSLRLLCRRRGGQRGQDPLLKSFTGWPLPGLP